MGRLKGGTPWNKGLTKTLDSRIITPSTVFKHGNIPWIKGKTKETDPKVKSPSTAFKKGHMPWSSGKHHTQESRDLISESNKGKEPWNKGTKGVCVSWNKGLTKCTDERVAKMGNRTLRTNETKDLLSKIHSTLESRNKKSNTLKRYWSDPEWAEMMMTRSLEGNQKSHPNKPEKRVLEILKSLVSDIKYVGDGKYWVPGTSKNPDFVNENKRQIIEVFGCFWHGCSRHFPDKQKYKKSMARIAEFKRLNHSVLVIWECELRYPEKVIAKIRRFEEGLA